MPSTGTWPMCCLIGQRSFRGCQWSSFCLGLVQGCYEKSLLNQKQRPGEGKDPLVGLGQAYHEANTMKQYWTWGWLVSGSGSN